MTIGARPVLGAGAPARAAPARAAGRLGSSASMRRNGAFSLAGFVVPTVVMFASYPVIVHRLGAEAFGLYVLATSFGGVLAFVDLGIATATVHFVAEARARGDRLAMGETLTTSLLFYGVLAATVSAAVALLAPSLAVLFHVPPALADAGLLAIRLGGLQIGVALMTNVFVAVFKGLERFDLVAWTNTVVSVLSYGAAALAVRAFGAGLRGVAVLSLATAVVVAAGSGVLAVRHCRAAGAQLARPRRSTFARLARFGSVMTVNSVGSVVMNQVPRLVIAARVGPAAVSAYTIAFSAASRIHAVVAVTTEVLFPMTSAASGLSAIRAVYLRVLAGSALLAGAAMIPLVAIPQTLLGLWLGGPLSVEAAPLLRAFAVAFFFLALSPAPYYVANGLAKPHWNSCFFACHVAVFVSSMATFGALASSWPAAVAWALIVANAVSVGAFLLFMERRFALATASPGTR